MMKTTIRVEKETTLNKAWLHIYTQREYYEDYQMPMIKKNKITGSAYGWMRSRGGWTLYI